MKSKKNKSVIDTYLTIYNVDIVVANKYTTLELINKLYENVEHQPFEDSDSDSAIAYTIIGYNKKTNRPIILVRHVRDSNVTTADKKVDLINTCAHEALHVCMEIYTKIEERVFVLDSNELFAYLIGWVTECIYKTWTKK